MSGTHTCDPWRWWLEPCEHWSIGKQRLEKRTGAFYPPFPRIPRTPAEYEILNSIPNTIHICIIPFQIVRAPCYTVCLRKCRKNIRMNGWGSTSEKKEGRSVFRKSSPLLEWEFQVLTRVTVFEPNINFKSILLARNLNLIGNVETFKINYPFQLEIFSVNLEPWNFQEYGRKSKNKDNNDHFYSEKDHFCIGDLLSAPMTSEIFWKKFSFRIYRRLIENSDTMFCGCSYSTTLWVPFQGTLCSSFTRYM